MITWAMSSPLPTCLSLSLPPLFPFTTSHPVIHLLLSKLISVFQLVTHIHMHCTSMLHNNSRTSCHSMTVEGEREKNRIL